MSGRSFPARASPVRPLVGQHDEPVTGRGRAPLLALLVLATSVCGSDDHERLLTGDDLWERDDQGVPPSVIRIHEGERHCDMDSALILEIHRPPDGGSTDGQPAATSVPPSRDRGTRPIR